MLRSKFVIALQGLERLVNQVKNFQIKLEEDVEMGKEIMDCIAVCVLDSEENCQAFLKAGGYEVMLEVIHKNIYLRSDSIKVISFCLTRCQPEHSFYLITKAECLPFLFSLLMKTQDRRPRKGEVFMAPKNAQAIADDLEHLLSILWNMLKHLTKMIGENPKIQIALERFLFKFLEEGKLQRILGIYQEYVKPLLDFDLSAFKETEEIEILESDY